MKIALDLSDKPGMLKLVKENPGKLKNFLQVWMYAADQLIRMGVPVQLITDTAEQVQLPAHDLVAGIIAGCLNEQFVNEDMAPILGKELLPLALFNMTMEGSDGDVRYFDWRKWYKLKNSTPDAEAIATAIGNLMKYSRFLSFDKLSEALESNQLIAFKALSMEQTKLLPFYPALRYQREIGGDFAVGKFFDDRKAGFFDCGEIEQDENECTACGRKDLSKTKDKQYTYCRACNAGYKIKGATKE